MDRTAGPRRQAPYRRPPATQPEFRTPTTAPEITASRALVAVKFLACNYGGIFARSVRSLGIRDHPISPLPWQNGYAVRLIGSICPECLDHVLVLEERQLRHVLSCHAEYYIAARTPLSIGKYTPIQRADQAIGRIQGATRSRHLHHQYART